MAKMSSSEETKEALFIHDDFSLKCENGGFTLKTHQIFSEGISPVILTEFRSAGKSQDYRNSIVFEKFRFQNVFRPH